jgi:hypothetical protein
MGLIVAAVIPRTSNATFVDDQRDKLDMEISSFQFFELAIGKYWMQG